MRYLIAFVLTIPAITQPNQVIQRRFSDPTGLSCTTATAPGYLYNGGIYTCQLGLYAQLTGTGSGITSLNGLTGASQTFTNDTNVTIVSSGTAHVITWTGTLAAVRGGFGTDMSACGGVATWVGGVPTCRSFTGVLGSPVASTGPTISAPTFTGLTSAGSLTLSGPHFIPVNGTTAGKPATCTTGEVYVATDATAGQNWYFCTATNTWTQQLNSGSGGVTVVGGGSLTSTAIVTGGGTTTLQTPSATTTLDSSGNISTPGSLTSGSGSGVAGSYQCVQGTAATVKANAFGWTCPTTMTTSVILQSPNAAPTTNSFMLFPAPTTNVSQFTWTPYAQTISATSHNFLTSFTQSTGAFTQAQPAFTDISGTATTAQLPTAANTRTASLTDLSPVSGDSGLLMVINPATAIHLTRAFCAVQGTTNVVINLDKRTEAAIGTDTGNHLLGADLTAVAGGANTTTFANGAGQCGGTGSCAIAAHAPVVMTFTSVSGTPTALDCSIDYTVD